MTSSPGRRQPVGGTANYPSRPAKSRPTSKQWLTVDEICEELGIHRRTWQRWRTRNKTPELHRLPNGDLRVHRDAYQAWLAGLKVGA